MYRLSLFRSVASARVKNEGWQTAFAQAVSHAACGNPEDARHALLAYQASAQADEHAAELAEALAPFMPREALQLLNGRERLSRALAVALLLRNGEHEHAQGLLGALPVEALRACPDLWLLQTNAFGGVPAEQLDRLNAYLAAHGLSPVQLRDGDKPPSPVNVVQAQVPVAVQGPLVTVLMTTFRTGGRAAVAIESVLAQSYRNLELIVVDDASGDETPALVEALARRDARVRLMVLPRNVGTFAAKLIGLSQARGEFVTCHDSDDWSHSEKIARQVAPLLEDERLVCTMSNWVRMHDDGQFYARQVYPLTRLNPSSPLFRRERVLREAGAWDCVRTGADSEFLARLRVVFGPRAIRKIAQPLSFGSHRADSLMTCSRTGYTDTGLSPQRLDYWEAWSHWHIAQLAKGRKPHVPPDAVAAAKARPFPVPDALNVPVADVEACLRDLRHQSTHN
jgi:hypothetical protein